MTKPPKAGKAKNSKLRRIVWSDRFFIIGLAVICSVYTGLIILMLIADSAYMVQGNLDATKTNPIFAAFQDANIRYSIILSLISCTLSAFFSIWIAIPVGYILSRYRFPGNQLVDAVLDIPIVLPPLVIGLSLLILFQFPPFTTHLGNFLPLSGTWAEESIASLTVYKIPAVILD